MLCLPEGPGENQPWPILCYIIVSPAGDTTHRILRRPTTTNTTAAQTIGNTSAPIKSLGIPPDWELPSGTGVVVGLTTGFKASFTFVACCVGISAVTVAGADPCCWANVGRGWVSVGSNGKTEGVDVAVAVGAGKSGRAVGRGVGVAAGIAAVGGAIGVGEGAGGELVGVGMTIVDGVGVDVAPGVGVGDGTPAVGDGVSVGSTAGRRVGVSVGSTVGRRVGVAAGPTTSRFSSVIVPDLKG